MLETENGLNAIAKRVINPYKQHNSLERSGNFILSILYSTVHFVAKNRMNVGGKTLTFYIE